MTTFFEEYNNLPRNKKAAFRRQIQDWCSIQYTTFQTWMREQRVPAMAKTIIALKKGKPENELFPENE